jgi:hypothetical protein
MSATDILFGDVFLIWVWLPIAVGAVYATLTKDW